jgi:PHD/YefM family antitoxin component YafN of YafNO toxin-antitoxin module
MVAITLNNAKNNLEAIVKQTIDNQEETILVTDNGNIVLVEEEQWNGMIETLRLFKDKRALNALLNGIEARKNGQPMTGKAVEEIFGDEKI